MTERDICERLRAARRVINTDPYGNRISAEPVELYREAADEIERLRAALNDGWQPIETASRDGSPILLFSPEAIEPRIFIGAWGECINPYTGKVEEACFYDLGNEQEFDVDLTHWCSLPEPSIATTQFLQEGTRSPPRGELTGITHVSPGGSRPTEPPGPTE